MAAADDPTSAFDRGETGARLEDLGDGRLALMDEAGVDLQVLSLTTPGLHNLAPEAGLALARRTNDLVAETVARRPDRFQGFAALPTPAPDAAPRELERAVRDLGLKGAMLSGRTGDKHLDHPDFRPLFDCAAALGVPLFIHPQIPLRAVRDANYSGLGPDIDLALAAFGLGWHYEAGLQFVRLVLAGTFDVRLSVAAMVVKTVVAVVVTVLVVLNRRFFSIPRGLLRLITLLVLVDAAVAVLW